MLPDPAELEEHVDWAYLTSRLDPYDCPTMVGLAKRLRPYIDAVVAVPGLARPAEVHAVANDNARFDYGVIRYRFGMPARQREWAVAGEVFEYRYRHGLVGVPNADRERVFRSGAARLVVHRAPLRALHRKFPWELARLADLLNTTELVVALRLGELLDLPIAVVGELFPHRSGGPTCWRRGPNWLPPESVLRAIVARGGLPGFRVVPFAARQLHLVALEDTDAASAALGADHDGIAFLVAAIKRADRFRKTL
jgi:hypothetical protein